MPTLAAFGEDQRRAIEAAVDAAEQKSAAEIVVSIAERSGRYDRAEDIFGFLIGLVAVSVAWLIWQRVEPDTSDWVPGYAVSMGLVAVLIILALWTVLGAAVASAVPALSRAFVGRREMSEEVRRRGIEAYHLMRVGTTPEAHGILIYVSLFEHMVWVSGDDAVNAKLGEKAFQGYGDQIAAGFRAGTPVDAIVQAVREIGDMLAPHFPLGAANPDQLPNTVRVMT
ncbi:MAG: hypothetical protein H7Y88_11750 [Phycisphaerales bacterium]|nr:hypothetical protein [Phycisphaerales bacterium]